MARKQETFDSNNNPLVVEVLSAGLLFVLPSTLHGIAGSPGEEGGRIVDSGSISACIGFIVLTMDG